MFRKNIKPKRMAAALMSVLMAVSAAAIPANAETTGEYVGEKDSVIKFSKVNLGQEHGAAITVDGSLYMWGDNEYGQIGDGTTTDRKSPVKIDLQNVVDVELGNKHSAAITADGSLYTWGSNEYGQLGDGTTTTRTTPKKVMQLDNVVSVSLGTDYSAAIINDGSENKLYTWGKNSSFQLGDNTSEDKHDPTEIAVNDPVSVDISKEHSSAVTADGSLYTWGSNKFGKLGIDGSDRPAPTKVIGIGSVNVKSVSLGETYTMVIGDDDNIYYCGSDNLANSARNNIDFKNKSGLSNIKSAAAYGTSSVAVTNDGTLYKFGFDNGVATTTLLSDVASYGIGHDFYAAVTTDGTLYTWGSSWLNGRLGRGQNNDIVDSPAPLTIKYPQVGKVGDMDHDGGLDSGDAISVLRASIGLDSLDDTMTTLADADNDGIVTSADALIVLRYSIGRKDNNYVGTMLYYKS